MAGIKRPECSLVAATDRQDIARRWIRDLQGVCEILVASTIPELHQFLVEYSPSAALIDLELSGLRGKDHLSGLLKLSPSTKVLFFAPHYDEGEALALIRIGGKGYSRIDTDPLLLRKAIQVIRKGEIWIPRGLVHRLLAEMQSMVQGNLDDGSSSSQKVLYLTTASVKLSQLTGREKQTAYLIGQGSSNKEIAGFLKISESTVKAHLSAVYHKLGLEDRLALALFINQQTKRAPMENNDGIFEREVRTS